MKPYTAFEVFLSISTIAYYTVRNFFGGRSLKELTVDDIEYLAIGAAVLGTGGGGDPYLGKLMAKQAIIEKGNVQLRGFTEFPDDWLAIPSSLMCAPEVLLEKLSGGGEPENAHRAIWKGCLFTLQERDSEDGGGVQEERNQGAGCFL
jgi:DUF917 family protein